MYYRLFNIGQFSIYSYGLMVAIGFIGGIILAIKRSKQVGENPQNILDLCLWLMISALIGARLFFVCCNWGYYKHNIVEIFYIQRGGLIFYGGTIFGIVAALFFLHHRKLAIWKYFDICAPSLAFAHALGRIGCFLNGCCYGKIITNPKLHSIGICFPRILNTASNHLSHYVIGAPAYLHQLNQGLITDSAICSLPVYPTQLISSGYNFILFLLLSICYNLRKFDGQIWWLYIISYSLARFMVEFIRGDNVHLPPLNLTFSQYLSMFFITCAILMYSYLRRKQKMVCCVYHE